MHSRVVAIRMLTQGISVPGHECVHTYLHNSISGLQMGVLDLDTHFEELSVLTMHYHLLLKFVKLDQKLGQDQPAQPTTMR